MKQGVNNKDARVIRSKRDLANALEELLQEKNYDDITIVEIVDRAMVSKLTFYNNFIDKKDLLTFMFQRYVNDIYSLSSKLDTSLSIQDRYKEILRIIIHYIFQSPDKFKKMIKNDSSKTMFWIFSSFIQQTTIKLSSYLSLLVKTTIPTNIIAYYYSGACTSLLYNMFLNSNNNLSEELMVEYIYKLTMFTFEK